MRSEAFDWRPGEGGLAWRQVQTFPRRNAFWKPFLFGALFALAAVVALVCWAVR